MAQSRAQVTLEACFIFVAIVLFFYGIFRMGLWFNLDMSDRSQAYNLTRKAAADNPDTGKPHLLENYYQQRPLTEGLIFAGKFSGPEEIAKDPNGGGKSSGRKWNGENKYADKHKPSKDEIEKAKNKIENKAENDDWDKDDEGDVDEDELEGIRQSINKDGLDLTLKDLKDALSGKEMDGDEKGDGFLNIGKEDQAKVEKIKKDISGIGELQGD